MCRIWVTVVHRVFYYFFLNMKKKAWIKYNHKDFHTSGLTSVGSDSVCKGTVIWFVSVSANHTESICSSSNQTHTAAESNFQISRFLAVDIRKICSMDLWWSEPGLGRIWLLAMLQGDAGVQIGSAVDWKAFVIPQGRANLRCGLLCLSEKHPYDDVQHTWKCGICEVTQNTSKSLVSTFW